MAFNIKEELKKLPDKPGVYLMKDEKSEIIYVGKAKVLKNRVRQYFHTSASKTEKVRRMVENIVEFEYIIVDSELEALILEANLIKKYQPKYNVLLRDDKQFPYIKVSTNERYPRIFKVRSIKKDKAKYFGPYISNVAVNDTIEIIHSMYKLRTCKLNLSDDKKHRPCLNYHMGKCLGPCKKDVDEEIYLKLVEEGLKFLNGKKTDIIVDIEEKMKEASKALNFELAAKYRDQINSLNHILSTQKVVSANLDERDIISVAIGTEDACVCIFFVRNGKILGREHFIIKDIMGETKKEVLSSFIKQFYSGEGYIPKEILIQEEFDDLEIVQSWISEKRGSNVYIKSPKIGEKRKLMGMAYKNAIQILTQSGDRIKKTMEEKKAVVEKLAKILNIEDEITRIEAYDISNTQGVDSVGSMIVFEDGRKQTRDYRKFKIKYVEGPDDYSSMEEVLTRRMERALNVESKELNMDSFAKIPDLIIMDGGKGQVNVAKKVLKKYNYNIPVCGLVKDDYHKTRGLIFEDEEIEIKTRGDVFKLLTEIQDEAHRFAIEYHKKLRSNKMFKSVLDEIPGIGKKRKENLLKYFGSIKKIKEAKLEELKEVDGMNLKSAEALYNFFNK